MDETERLHIAVARERKIRRLIALLDEWLDHDWQLTAQTARRLTEEQWYGLGVLDAKVNQPTRDLATVQAPSLTTRQMVILALDERLAIRSRVAAKPHMRSI